MRVGDVRGSRGGAGRGPVGSPPGGDALRAPLAGRRRHTDGSWYSATRNRGRQRPWREKRSGSVRGL